MFHGSGNLDKAIELFQIKIEMISNIILEVKHHFQGETCLFQIQNK